MLIPLIFNAKDYDASFDNFVSQVEEVSDPSTEIAERLSPVVLLDKKSAIIAFTPIEAVPNGRLGDGNLHVIQNKDVSYQVEAIGTSHPEGYVPTPKQFHFIRPDSCAIDKTCFCLCNKLFEEELDNQLPLASLVVNPTTADAYNPYRLGYSQEIKDSFLYDATAKEDNIILNCKSLRCQETDTNLFMPLKSDYFSELYQKSIMFENGFILSREGYYGAVLPERVTINIIKLINKQILIATQLSAILDVDTIIKVSRSLTESSLSTQMSEALKTSGLQKLYTEEALGSFIRKTPFSDQTTTLERETLRQFYDGLTTTIKQRYTLDEKTGNLYQDATPYDFLPTAMKSDYVMNPDKSFIRTNNFIDVMTLRALFDDMPREVTANYYINDNGDIIHTTQ